MKLKSVRIENFRGIKALELPLDSQLTVFIGDNAAGKTTILDAIAHVLSPLPYYLVRDFENDQSKQFYKYFQFENFRIIDHKNQKSSGHCCISANLLKQIKFEDHADTPFILSKWNYMRIQGEDEPDVTQFDEFYRYIKALFYRVTTENPDISLPLVSYYDNRRGNFYVPQDARQKHRKTPEPDTHPRFLALQNTLAGIPRAWGVFDWFLDQEDLERREREKQKNWNYKLPLLETVRQAICRMMPNISSVRTEIRPKKQLYLDFKVRQDDTETLSLDQLSDGYRTLLAIVIDLARRMAQANPHLNNPIESEAIVLIDEVDLHLHPKWQQTVLTDLMRTFPNAQFIVTTHSPQVLTSIKEEHIIELRREAGNIVAYSADTSSFGAESGRLLEDIMGVSERPPAETNRFSCLLSDFYTHLEMDELAEAESLLAQMRQESPNDPAIISGEMDVRRRKALLKRSKA